MLRNIALIIIFCLFTLEFLPGCKQETPSVVGARPLKVDSVYSWLVNMQQSNGLLLSSEGGNYVSLYDNTLAAIAFTAYGDYNKAEKESELLKSPGGF